MMAGIVLAVLIAYLAILFVTAQRAESASGESDSAARRGVLYALSLTVYCTSWSYFASIGDAARGGWNFIGFYIGPALAVTVFAPMWHRIAVATKREKSGSVADFLASRYGRSHALGALVTAVALVTALPHIALQLNALATGWLLVSHGRAAPSSPVTVILIAIVLLAFAIAFGARRADLTAQNRGLLHALGIQSVVKLAALVAVAGFGAWMLFVTPDAKVPAAVVQRFERPPALDSHFFSILFLGFSAMFCVPKQFHVGFVQLREVRDLRVSRWMLPLYLAVCGAVVLPIVAAGATLLPAHFNVPALYVLSLPLNANNSVLASLVTIGGFSAAASMVVVETVALSAMVSNELLLPWITWRTQRRRPGDPAFASIILHVRRVTMCVVMGAACIFVLISPLNALTTIGIASFVAGAQLLPLIVGAVYWQRASLWGALAGLTGGMAAWLWVGMTMGVTGEHSPGYTAMDPLTYTILLSLSVNVGLFVAVSLLAPTRMIDRVTAQNFIHGLRAPLLRIAPGVGAKVDDLRRLMSHFLGDDGARQGFEQFASETGQGLGPEDRVTPALAHAAERMLAGFIGSSSARGVIAVALAGPYGSKSTITTALDDARGAVEFSRAVLQSSLDNLPQGVCVLDAERRVIAWNNQFLEAFELQSELVSVQRPWTTVASHVEARCIAPTRPLASFGADGPDRGHIECRIGDDRFVRITHAVTSEGGAIFTFTDVSEDRGREAALRDAAVQLERANETLEERVRDRTQALEAAKAQAERADLAKSRFVAAASHDLLQPLHAARLFIGALSEDLKESPERAAIAADAGRAIGSADRMLRALLNLSRLDAGGIQPVMRPIAVNDLMTEICNEFAQTAAHKAISLRMVPNGAWLLSDRDLLRSILQNLVVNAIRYTDRGSVLIGCRNEGDSVRIEVWDTGSGIAGPSLKLIFGEFVRLQQRPGTEPGMGLGLAIVDRVAHSLGHGLLVRSIPGRGSVFSVTATRVPPAIALPSVRPPTPPAQHLSLAGLRVLCVDDDAMILEGLRSLLTRWDAQVTCARGWHEIAALGDTNWDVALLDYHIDGEINGLAVLARIEPRVGCAAIVTADPDADLREAVHAAGATLLKKPLDPERLRGFLVEAYRDQLAADDS